MSRADAIAHCKSSPGGAVVVIEDKVEWDETRTALQRAGVRIYVRERVGDEHGPAPAPVIYQPRREIVADPPVVAPPAPSK